MNRFKTSLLLVFLLCNILSISASDFDIIYNRMYNEYISNPSTGNVEDIMKRTTKDGSIFGINYKATDGSPRIHLPMLITLAAAYKNPENKYYRNTDVKNTYLAALRFWVETNNNATNWWFRFIPYPKELSKSVILMRDEIKGDKNLFDKTVAYLRWSYESAKPSHMTGANGCDIIMGSIAASVISENHEQMLDFKNKMTELFSIQINEGIEADYMYGQHSGSGRQLYLTNYGKEYINSVLYYFEFCNKTQYASSGLNLLEDFYINGIQWIFYSKNYDPNHAGRFNTSDKFYGQFESMTNRILKLNTARKTEIKKVYDRIRGENSLTGNRMFWRVDYMIPRRANYMVSSRMSSTRTVGAEAGNGDGEFNYYSGNGTNYIFHTGSEYNGDYFKNFNNRQFPGITAEQDNDPLPIPEWGVGGGNGNAFAGGVSDSTYGACAMLLDRRQLKAHKAWFYFEDEFVCLGAGITQNNGKANVYTTLNQCNASGSVQYASGGKTKNLKETSTIKQPEWILHGKIGYFNLDKNAGFVIACDTSLFSANINHGTNPKNATYAYLVKPGVKSGGDADKYFKSLPVSILSNTEDIQAVRHNTLKITQVIFYTASKLNLNNNTSITVNAPCALMWNEISDKISVANPKGESDDIATLKVSVSKNNQISEIDFQLPQVVKAGSTVTSILK